MNKDTIQDNEDINHELGLTEQEAQTTEEVEADVDEIPLKKITRSEFGNRFLTKQIAIISCLLVTASLAIHFFLPDTSIKIAFNFLVELAQWNFLQFILIGFIAQMIDGALGMAYGASCNTMLLSAGVTPGAANQIIKLSEVFTTAASGFSHWKMGNINKKLLKNLIIPGIIGALAGSLLLVSLEKAESWGKLLKPAVSFYVLCLGFYLIYKATRINKGKGKVKQLNVLALIGGFLDAIGGGGWGPIVTSGLLSKGRTPKYTIGSVNLAEFFIALTGAVTLTWALKLGAWKMLVGIIIGGVMAAPIGAFVAGKVKAKPLMILVGVLIIIVNTYMLLKYFGIVKG